MDFNTFCKETSKIIVLQNDMEKNTVPNTFDLPYLTFSQGKSIQLDGLYFPNDKELKKFYEDLGGDLFYTRNRRYLPFMQVYFCNTFVDKFNKYLNLHLNIDFEEVKNFLSGEKEEFNRKVEVRRLKKEPENDYEPINLHKLTELIGQVYEKSGLLERDIRFEAMKIGAELGLELKVIGHMEKEEGGYSGLGFVVPKLEK
jgi:hypothetical protein